MNQVVFNLRPHKQMTWPWSKNKRSGARRSFKNLSEAKVNQEYMISNVIAEDEGIVNFLFSLGCFEGEPVTVISVLSDNYVIAIKDARYSIDSDLAKAVILR